ncbi:MAG: hypothetical protein OXE02_10735 [Chloroflexi bacterium]|nr:hypothetical protein [Chloroflexota bacterium]
MAPKPLQAQSLNRSTRNGLTYALITTYQPHMNNPLPPRPRTMQIQPMRPVGAPSNDEIVRRHTVALTEFYMRYCREFIVEVPVIPSGYTVKADGFLEHAKKLIETLDWYRVYDLLEFWVEHYPGPRKLADRLAERIEAVLVRENVDHRLLNGRFIPVSDDVEKEAIATAMDNANVPAHIRAQIDKAVDFIRTGDYRQSAHEAVSAVEAQCRIIIGKPDATLGTALKELGGQWQLHPALVKTYSQMYGWSSNESGVRHSIRPDSETMVDYPLAKLILIQCAGFINYAEVKLMHRDEQQIDTKE